MNQDQIPFLIRVLIVAQVQAHPPQNTGSSGGVGWSCRIGAIERGVRKGRQVFYSQVVEKLGWGGVKLWDRGKRGRPYSQLHGTRGEKQGEFSIQSLFSNQTPNQLN